MVCCCCDTSLFVAISVGIFAIAYRYFRKYIQGPRFTRDVQIDDGVVLITGANTGIGKQTAIEMLKRGARVCIACRSLERGEAAKKEIIAESGSNNITLRKLDLASFKSIREFAATFKRENRRLDILINNAAVTCYNREVTEDGLELQMGVNHFGHFLLTNLLLDLLKKSTPSRIITVSSLGHLGAELNKEDLMNTVGYTMIGTYRQSKLANVLFTKELSRRLKDTGVTAFSLHPGAIDTDLIRDVYKNRKWLEVPVKLLTKAIFKTKDAGVQTTLYCALEPDIEHHSGKYFSDCQLAETVNPLINDENLCKWLWDQSEKITHLGKNE